MAYTTTQKQAVLRWVKDSRNHPTAQEVFEGLKSDMPTLSFATVYRNLAALAKEGQINEVQFLGQKKRYEGLTHEHQHFICEKCNRIIDMELSELLNVKEACDKMQCHDVRTYNLELIGTCAACMAKVKKK